MIKFDIKPVSWVVAVGTGVAKEILVYVILAMAVDTVGRRVAMFRAGRVAAGAFGIRMLADQFEVGKQVIERRFNQLDDVGIATLVIGMTGRTGLVRDRISFAVKAELVAEVRGDILVAVATQSILAGTIKRYMAGRTFRLELCMPANQITRHDQRLNSLSSSRATCEADKQCNKFRQSESSLVHKLKN